MPKLGYYQQGDWNATCDVCGRGFKFSQLRKKWDNTWACRSCWEPRQPQDFARGIPDNSSVPIARPRVLPATIQYITTVSGDNIVVGPFVFNYLVKA